ncbi:MAG: OmpA family protein [Deltaproteobacteria bacterium]|nr:OmpA family protein [Deltaproteobacteria bacterium]
MRARAIGLMLMVAAGSAAAESFRVENHELVVPHPITFASGKAELTPESDAGIAYVKAYLDAKSYVTLLRIEVHSDAAGSASFNQRLTEQRALTLGRALVARGIACTRLLSTGFGSTKPVADDKTPEGRAANRRIVFANAELRGRAIGGMPVDGGGKVAGDLCTR